MSEQLRISQSVMEGGGAYHRHARHQTAAASAAGQFLERAISNLALDPGAEPIVIADYGSSQGRNSQAPMSAAIRSLRPRLTPAQPIFVYHVDQPSNDFNTLFEVLGAPESYARNNATIFPAFMPSLASALDRSSDAGAVRAFGDRLERGIRQGAAINPAPLEIKAQVIVLAKR
jgi:SAM dependent carboxyl methyltransferase